MKEQLMKELVKTGKEANVMNRQYEDKIKGLERVCMEYLLRVTSF